MPFKADVYVTLKRTVNDPKGLTIQGGLQQLGFTGVTHLRAGKYLEIWLDAPDRPAAEQQVEQMCAQLLANPVIEDYRFTVTEGVAAGAAGA